MASHHTLAYKAFFLNYFEF